MRVGAGARPFTTLTLVGVCRRGRHARPRAALYIAGRGGLRRLPGPGVVYGLDDVSDCGDHELGLLVLDVVAALLRDGVLAVSDKPGELVLELSPQAFVGSDQPRVGSRRVRSAVSEHDQGHRVERSVGERGPRLREARGEVDLLRIEDRR